MYLWQVILLMFYVLLFHVVCFVSVYLYLFKRYWCYALYNIIIIIIIIIKYGQIYCMLCNLPGFDHLIYTIWQSFISAENSDVFTKGKTGKLFLCVTYLLQVHVVLTFGDSLCHRLLKCKPPDWDFLSHIRFLPGDGGYVISHTCQL